jgi:serine/threonine protein kinase
MRHAKLCRLTGLRSQMPSVFLHVSSLPWRSTCQRSNISTSPDPIRYEYIEGAEMPHRYEPRGYHPINIGDILHQRYRVVDNLGYGSFSTIWLAQDTALSRYVAVKVGTASSDNKEADILSKLSNPTLQDGNRGRDMIQRVFDRFSIHGLNGTYPCSVTSAARCSLSDINQAALGVYRLPVVRSFAAQLVLALAYMHKQGVVHGGEYQP